VQFAAQFVNPVAIQNDSESLVPAAEFELTILLEESLARQLARDVRLCTIRCAITPCGLNTQREAVDEPGTNSGGLK